MWIMILLLSLAVALLCLAVFAVIERSQRAQAALRIEAEQQRGTLIIANQIEVTFSQFVSDLLIIYNSNEAADYAKKPSEKTLDEFSALHSRIMGQKQYMQRVRFFDRDGMKVSQMQRLVDGSLNRVEADELVRSEEDLDVFRQAHNIGLRTLYISDIQHSRVMGHPMITLALPLFQGSMLSGVLAIDYDGCALLSFLSAYQATIEKELSFRLVTVDGTILIDSWQQCVAVGENLVSIWDESPALQSAMAKRDLGVLHEHTQSFVWQTIYPRTDDLTSFKGANIALWRVVSSYRHDQLPHLSQFILLRYPAIKHLVAFVVFVATVLVQILYHQRRGEREQLQISSLVAEYAENGIIVCDQSGRITFANKAFLRLSGYQRAELLGRASTEFRRTATGDVGDTRPCWLTGRGGDFFLYNLSITEAYAHRGTGPRIEVYTPYNWPAQREIDQAIVDPLIELLGLEQMIKVQGEVSALIIQLQNRKEIGLQLSQGERSSLALSISTTLATLFGGEVSVSAFGYDGYLVLLPKMGLTESLVKKIRRAFAVLQSPPDEQSKALTLRLACGVANVPSTSYTAKDLLTDAFFASERALTEKGREYVFYTGEVRTYIQRKGEIAKALGSLFGSGQLSLAYQPVVSLNTQTIVGAEALIRWNHPTLKAVRPDEFLNAVFEAGLSERLGRFVIAHAVHFLERHQAKLKELQPQFTLAINLSAEEFSNPTLIDYLGSMLREYRIKDHQVCVELTEHTAIGNLQSANATIAKLRAQGVMIAIDDFGTGYSSLSYLLELAADKVKIDRSFIARFPSTESSTIYKTVMLLAKEIKARVVAEGVETEEQLDFIRSIGCDEYQGYYFSPAVDEERFIALLEETNRG